MGWEALGHAKTEQAFPQTFPPSPQNRSWVGGGKSIKPNLSPRNGPGGRAAVFVFRGTHPSGRGLLVGMEQAHV